MEEDEFQKIIDEALAAAAKVHCPVEDYIEGLKFMIAEIEMAVDAAKCNL